MRAPGDLHKVAASVHRVAARMQGFAARVQGVAAWVQGVAAWGPCGSESTVDPSSANSCCGVRCMPPRAAASA